MDMRHSAEVHPMHTTRNLLEMKYYNNFLVDMIKPSFSSPSVSPFLVTAKSTFLFHFSRKQSSTSLLPISQFVVVTDAWNM